MTPPCASSSNIDPQEVQKFEDMAANWWDPNGPCKPLHDLNPLRLQFILSHCELANKKILDVGCGGGILTEALSKQAHTQVWGLDQSQQALAVAQAHAQAQNLSPAPTYIFETVEHFATLHPQGFEVITCMEMLEHVPDPLSVLSACADLLTPGGDLFCSTLNRTPTAFIQAILGAEYLLKLLPRGTHEYGRFIKPSELASWCRPLGLQLQHLQGLSYRVADKTFYLSDTLKVNYLIHFKKEAVCA